MVSDTPEPYGLAVPNYEAFGINPPYFGDSVWNALKEKSNKFNYIKIKVQRKADGTEKVEVIDSVREKRVFIIHSWYLSPASHVMVGGQIADALGRADAERISLVEPFNPYHSYDARDPFKRNPITANIVAEFYNGCGIGRVMTFDPHSKQLEGFFGEMDPLDLTGFAANYIRSHYKLENFVVSPPDDGRSEIAERFAKKLGIEAVKMKKKRATEGEGIEWLEVLGDVAGRNVLIVDDMIRTGGTIEEADDALKKGGAKDIYVYATHIGLYGDAYERLSRRGLHIIGTNTIPQRNGRELDLIDISELTGEIIHRKTNYQSVSEFMRDF